MNLVLVSKNDFTGDSGRTVRVEGRRHKHIRSVLKAAPGDTIKVGQLNSLTGTGVVRHMGKDHTILDITLTALPPAHLPAHLILALPRPKVVRRVLQAVTAMGVKHISLINAWRVEKSFWQSPILSEESITEQLILGLEQARDTLLPEVRLFKGFKPFVEDHLGEIVKHSHPIVAHPAATTPCPRNIVSPVTLAIGPEGGFIPYEIDKLVDCGFTPVNVGERILKVETAIPAILGRLF